MTTLLGSLYDLLFAVATSAAMIGLAVALFGVRLDVAPGGGPLLLIGLTSTVLFLLIGDDRRGVHHGLQTHWAVSAGCRHDHRLRRGVWFPLQLLPRPLEIAANLLPFTWAVDVLRLTILAGEQPVLQCTVLTGSALLCLPLSLWTFHRCARRTRRDGSLGFY